MRSADGRLWFPMVNGVIVVDPKRLTENRVPPPVVIERVVVDGRVLARYGSSHDPGAPGAAPLLDLHQPNASLCLGPGPRQVELEYTGLSFVSPRNVTFKYRLAGLDRDWVMDLMCRRPARAGMAWPTWPSGCPGSKAPPTSRASPGRGPR